MMYDLLNKARKDGLVALEADIEDPAKSPILSKYPAFLKDHHIRDFVCDTMRMAVSGGVGPFDLDQMMELDMDVHHHDASQPVQALSAMADSLPGLGIVAAVLGVVITMGALGGPPEEIGHKVAAALVGTFLGILLCYGLVGPVAANMAKLAEDEHAYYHVLRVLMSSFMKGAPPIMAVEVARRAIPGHVRPGFKEVEKTCRHDRRVGGRGQGRSIAAWPPADEAKQPIIIIKKKAGHGGHHGGAWKVAYADFVTAMMALFIVLWLMNSSKQIQVAVGGYFKDPTGTSKKVGSNQTGSGENFTLTKDNMPKLKEELQMAVRQIANFDKLKNQIEMTITSEGLRIELLESSSGTFFESGKPGLNDDGRELLVALAQQLGKLPNHISIEGHTDAKPYTLGPRIQQLGTLRRPRELCARDRCRAAGLRG